MNTFTFENYPDIRDLTRKHGKDIQIRIGGHLETVKGHLRPASVFGPYLSSNSKSAAGENPKNAAAAFVQLKALFKQVGVPAPFNL
ncbi:MAG TPA: hypothetical protein VGN17_18130, partial [Bryobacteraceae bacterium]